MVLPLLGYYGQAGTFGGFPVEVLAFLLPTHLACAIATSLPDEPSDRVTGKRTLAVVAGLPAARITVVALNLASAGLLVAFAPLSRGSGWLWLVVGVVALSSVVSAVVARWAKPGSFALLVFVFFSILATVGMTSALSIGLLLSDSGGGA